MARAACSAVESRNGAIPQLSCFPTALGMVYDSADHLFVATAPNQVAQMDPNTGAILNSVTFDLNDLTARGVYALPTNLSGATLLAGTLNVLANGLTWDGNGRLYIAAANSLDGYFISTDTVQVVASDPGINDIALPALVQKTIRTGIFRVKG